MQMQSKYSELKTLIENPIPEGIQIPRQEGSFYYFKALSELSLDILLQETELNELHQKLEFMRAKYTQMSAKYAMRRRKEEQKRIIHCEQDECRLTFMKDKELHYHKLFEHENEQLMNGRAFSWRVEEEEQRE